MLQKINEWLEKEKLEKYDPIFKFWEFDYEKKIQVHFVFEKFILKDNNDVNNLENFIKLNNIINNYDYRNINFLKKIKVIN